MLWRCSETVASSNEPATSSANIKHLAVASQQPPPSSQQLGASSYQSAATSKQAAASGYQPAATEHQSDRIILGSSGIVLRSF